MKGENKTFAPSYYGEFKCIADKCRHSCCVDWEIYIDDATYAKYKGLKDIADTVEECEDGRCFALTDSGRCPHLNSRGLCDIIIAHGEDFLTEICKNHPRFYNCVFGGRTEVGLGIVCEEACRIILQNEKPFSLIEIGEEGVCETPFDDRAFNALPHRDRIISIIELRDKCLEEKIALLRGEFFVPDTYTLTEWIRRLLTLEILDGAWERDLRLMLGRGDFEGGISSGKYRKYYERLLTYFVYRHVSVAGSKKNLSARLGFCILSVEIVVVLFERDLKGFSSLDLNGEVDLLAEWARRYSAEIEYDEDNTDELIFAFESKLE